ncbi:hypothetical protein [Micromonospora thermarum]|uniref:Uncharacterized protein n=1 Tax=Micromonospora thermarum TaxID=2720024 RepID=A0ABX0Z052_9ACTN|nr:hypothetical protein [Micromonospora thermarum]NJP31121.1 hypothetical protein [Micromonospora thermarum]
MAAELAGRASARGVRAYGDSVVTDLRTAASDLLRATGCSPADANTAVRRMAGAGQEAVRRERAAATARRSVPGDADGPAAPVGEAGP